MKIIIPAEETKKNVCVSFGRAPFFAIYDTETEETEFIDNPAADAEGGAGLLAAQTVADSGAEALITIRCGENAGEVMKAAEIKVYKSGAESIADNIELFKEEKLAELTHFHAGYHGLK